MEFLEETLMYKGITHQASACKTDFGIAWANINGVYLFDGQQIQNLLERDGRRLISEQEWLNFLSPGKDSSYDELHGGPVGDFDDPRPRTAQEVEVAQE